MGKPSKPRKNRADRSPDEKAEAGLRKRGFIWWAHFGFKGQFFRFSLGTSDRSKAKRQAKKLITLAEAGKISAVAQTPAERSARRSASLRRSHTDPKVSAKVTRANRKSWSTADQERHDHHSEAIKNALAPPEVRALMSERSTENWKRPGYRERNSRAVRKGWAPKRLRKQQSNRLKAACARPEVQENRLKGRARFYREFLRKRGVLKEPGKPGRRRTPTEERDFFKHGRAIEISIPPASRADQRAIEGARAVYSREAHMPRALCATYHRRFRAFLRDNPSFIPDGASFSR